MSDQALAQAELVVRTIAQTAVDNEKYFCELDAAAGDGDFGYSLARGFEIVISDWDEIDRTDAGTLLKKTAIILTKRIGGTSGPIWGTAFLRAGCRSAATRIRAARTSSRRCARRSRGSSSGAARSSAIRHCSTPSPRPSTSSNSRCPRVRSWRSDGRRRSHVQAPRRRTECSPSAAARPTRAIAAVIRPMRARSRSRSCSRPCSRPGSRHRSARLSGRAADSRTRPGCARKGRRQRPARRWTRGRLPLALQVSM